MNYKSRAPITQETNLPAPVPTTGLYIEVTKLDAELTALIEEIDETLDPVEIPPRTLAAWGVVNRPATNEEITIEATTLLGNIPLASNIDLNLRTKTLIYDISIRRPTLFALRLASYTVRTTCKFFDQPTLFREIDSAERKSLHVRLGLEFCASEPTRREKEKQREERRARKEQERLDTLKKTDRAKWEREIRSEMDDEDLHEEYLARCEAARRSNRKERKR